MCSVSFLLYYLYSLPQIFRKSNRKSKKNEEWRETAEKDKNKKCFSMFFFVLYHDGTKIKNGVG
jgi:hypothetical protein